MQENSAMTELTLNDLKQALSGHAAAFRAVTDHQPAGERRLKKAESFRG
jgi:hypothetical protein